MKNIYVGKLPEHAIKQDVWKLFWLKVDIIFKRYMQYIFPYKLARLENSKAFHS